MLLVLTLGLLASPADTRDLNANLSYLPGLAETSDKGILINLIRRIDEDYREGRIKVRIKPFARSLMEVRSGEADFHLPFLDAGQTMPGYRLSSLALFYTHFALYTNSRRPPVLKSQLFPSSSDFRPELVVETDIGHVHAFDFPIQGSACLECSLKKLVSGRIDGVLFAQKTLDGMIVGLGLDNLSREIFATYAGKIVFSDNDRGRQVEAIIVSIIEHLRVTGEYQVIMAGVGDD